MYTIYNKQIINNIDFDKRAELPVSIIIPYYRGNLAEKGKFVNNNRLKFVIFRLKAEVTVFFVKSFNGCLVLNQCYNNVAVFGNRGLLDYNNIAVTDMGVNHRIALYVKRKIIAQIGRASCRERV